MPHITVSQAIALNGTPAKIQCQTERISIEELTARQAQEEPIATFQWGANFEITGKTDPQKLSGPWAWQNQSGTLADLADHLSKGRPFMPSLLSGNRRRWQTNANYASMLALDIDEGLTIADALSHPFLVEHCGLAIETTSSKPDHNKFRLVFPLMEAIEGHQNIKLATLYLQSLVGSADKACSDASRFYFGSLGRSPFLLQEVTLPANFLEQALAWQAENDRLKAAAKAERERVRREQQERIRANGNADLVALVEQANDRLGVDAFLPYLEHQGEKSGKYRCKPAFRTGSGSHSAFVAESNGIWTYQDPTAGHGCDGFRFYCWQKRGEKYKPTGKDFIELAKEYCSIAGIDVPEWPPTRTIGFTTKPKSKAQEKREWRNIQANITRKAILKPFADRPYDVTCTTKAELEQAILDNPYCFIDGPTGSGKTEAFRVLLDNEVNHIGFNPLRSLSRGAAAALGQAYWNTSRKGILDSAWACIHSVLPVLSAKRLYDRTYLYFDEIEQSLEALITSKLCEENRQAKIHALQDECSKAERIVAASATAALKELNYLEAISGKRFTLIRFDPKLHKKGSFTIYTAQEGVKGSNKAALNHVRSLSASPRTYIASDSSDKAIETLLCSEIPTLLINQRTAHDDDDVQSLLSSPNPGEHFGTTGFSNIVASPTVQSGFSIKGNQFDQVLGLFSGKSISPSNCVQQLERYRSSVPRNCYAPRYSAPPANIGTSYAPKGVGSFKERQAKQWELEADHLQNTVKTGAFTGFNFLEGPEREWFREWELQRDREFRNFAVAIEAYATRQGFKKVQYATPPAIVTLKTMRDEVNEWKADPIFIRGNDRPLHKSEVSDLLADGKELSQSDSDRIEAYLIRDYYGLAWNAPLTKEKIIDEGFGNGRKALRKALRILWDGQALADDQAQRDKLGDRGYVWDTTNHATTLKWWDRLGIDDVLAFCLENPYSSASPEIREFSDRLAEHQEELGEGSRLLGVKIPWRYEDAIEHYGKVVKWLGMMLKSLGIETKSKRVRDDVGNILPRVYTIVPETLDKLREALKHKAEKQIRQGFTPRSTPLFRSVYEGVDQTEFLTLWDEYQQALDQENEDIASALAEKLDKFQEF